MRDEGCGGRNWIDSSCFLFFLVTVGVMHVSAPGAQPAGRGHSVQISIFKLGVLGSKDNIIAISKIIIDHV